MTRTQKTVFILVALVFPGQYLVDGQAQDQCDQGNENEDGFLGSSHRFNSK